MFIFVSEGWEYVEYVDIRIGLEIFGERWVFVYCVGILYGCGV